MNFKFVQDMVRIRILWDELHWRSRFTVCDQQAGMMGYGQLMHNLHPFQRRCQNLEIILQFLQFWHLLWSVLRCGSSTLFINRLVNAIVLLSSSVCIVEGDTVMKNSVILTKPR